MSQCECTAQWQRINELATTTRRVGDDEATTRQQNKANTGPTRDPNYKREPFATHSGKITSISHSLTSSNTQIYQLSCTIIVDLMSHCLHGTSCERATSAWSSWPGEIDCRADRVTLPQSDCEGWVPFAMARLFTQVLQKVLSGPKDLHNLIPPKPSIG